MKPTNFCVLTLLLLGALSCTKNELTVGPSSGPATHTAPPSMTGGWGVTWLGWFADYSGRLTGTMTLTEKDSTLSGSIFLCSQTFSVAGFVSSNYQVTLSGSDGVYEYSIIGTVDASKSILQGNVKASHMVTVPLDTVGSATMSASRYK